MGGSGSGGRAHVDPGGGGPSPRPGGGGTEEEGGGPRTGGCPTEFPAEVTDIPEDKREQADGVSVGAVLPVELRENDPVFLLDGGILGWLATNIEEVTACLEAGWTYQADVTATQQEPDGPVITTEVQGTPPGQ